MDAEARNSPRFDPGHLGPDHKAIAMSDFYSALVQALKDARERGHKDHRGVA